MKERKEKKRWGLIVFMTVIMIGTTFSFVFYGFSGASQTVKYNGIKFTNNGQYWLANIKGRQAAFSFLPEETGQIPVEGQIPSLQDRLEIDVTSDVNSSLAGDIALTQHQMGLTLANYNIYLRQGFTSNNSYNMPIITCDDSTGNVPVIYFRFSNQTRISIEGSCILAQASDGRNLIMAKDRLVYNILGVLNG